MTRISVDPGICGFPVTVIAEKGRDGKIKVVLETECETLKKMQEDLPPLDARALVADFRENPVYSSAAKHIRHAACPVAGAILKAVEVEEGLALPRDVHMVFLKD